MSSINAPGLTNTIWKSVGHGAFGFFGGYFIGNCIGSNPLLYGKVSAISRISDVCLKAVIENVGEHYQWKKSSVMKIEAISEVLVTSVETIALVHLGLIGAIGFGVYGLMLALRVSSNTDRIKQQESQERRASRASALYSAPSAASSAPAPVPVATAALAPASVPAPGADTSASSIPISSVAFTGAVAPGSE